MKSPSKVMFFTSVAMAATVSIWVILYAFDWITMDQMVIPFFYTIMGYGVVIFIISMFKEK